MLTIDYIGSKKSLLYELDNVFSKLNITSDTIFGDLFAGTGSVSYFVSRKYNAKIISNDMLYFAYIINKAKLTKYSSREVYYINSKIEEYNKLKPIKSFITKSYSPPSRMYFTIQNGMKIDAIRIKLNEDLANEIISNKIYTYLLASLLSATNKISNISVVYAAYLKSFKNTALKSIKLNLLNYNETVKKSATVYNKNVLDLDKNFDIVYLDPPYNHRQYGDNYHVLETIAKYNDFDLYGITGLSKDIIKSKFSKKTEVEDEFIRLIKFIKTKTIVLSYNSEGILSKKFISRVLQKEGIITLKSIKYKKFKAQENVKEKFVYEYIFTCVKL